MRWCSAAAKCAREMRRQKAEGDGGRRMKQCLRRPIYGQRGIVGCRSCAPTITITVPCGAEAVTRLAALRTHNGYGIINRAVKEASW